MEVIGRYSNPPRTPVDLGELAPSFPAEDGFEPIHDGPGTRYRRLGQDQIERLLADYELGAGFSELAEKYGINYTTVKAHLDRAGVPRPVGPGKLSPIQIQRAADQYCGGRPVTRIATDMAVDEETLRRALRRIGVHFRSPS